MLGGRTARVCEEEGAGSRVVAQQRLGGGLGHAGDLEQRVEPLAETSRAGDLGAAFGAAEAEGGERFLVRRAAEGRGGAGHVVDALRLVVELKRQCQAGERKVDRCIGQGRTYQLEAE